MIQAELAALTSTSDSAPAIAVAVAHHGRIIWEAGFGFVDTAKITRATPHTPFAVASIAKAVTATALMRLSDRGAIEIDQPLHRFLPSEVRVLAGDSNRLTPAALAGMTGGIPHLARHYWSDGAPSSRTARQLVSEFGLAVFPPGEMFHYSNLSFGILERLIEAVTGRAFATVVEQEVFRPLGMRNSFFASSDQTRSYAVRRTPTGSVVREYVFTEPVAGAGLVASAHDLALFGAFHAGRPLAGQPVLTSAALDRMHQPQRVEWSYGLGLFTNGYSMIADGSVLGGAGIVSIIPSEELAVVVVTNAASDNPPTYQFVDRLIDAALSMEGRTRRSMQRPYFFVTRPFAADSTTRGTWAGTVLHPVRSIPVTLTISADSILITLDGSPAARGTQPVIDAGMLRFQFHGALPSQAGTIGVTLYLDRDTLTGYIREPNSSRLGLGYPRYIRLTRQ